MVIFNKVKDEHGWLSNMSPYQIKFGGELWKTTEALFQSLRFKDKDIKELIRLEKSPMGAKNVMNDNSDNIVIEKHSTQDLVNMMMCLRFKLKQHPELVGKLKNTGDEIIIEDVTSRGDIGGNLFWGSMLVNGKWVGQNKLGNLWMNLRDEIK